MTKHSSNLPNYIVAQSLRGLRRSMYIISAKHGAGLTFYSIQHFTEKSKTKWVAFYNISIENIEELDNDDAE